MNKNGLKKFFSTPLFNGNARKVAIYHQQYPRVRMVVIVLIGLLVILGCSEKSSSDLAKDPPTEQTHSYTGTIVTLGDSLTAGMGVDEDRAYPAQLARRLQADGHNYQVINAGVSGETSSGARSRMEWVISSLNPDIVILETGANDGLRGWILSCSRPTWTTWSVS